MDELLLFIEKGIPDGHEYTYREAADENVNIKSGSIVFKVETVNHPTFVRVKEHLKTTVQITLKEALLGFEKSITHLDGHKVWIKRKNQMTRPGLIDKIKGEGMPIFEYPSDYGDLVVTFKVEMPRHLNEMQVDGFKQFFNKK